MQKNIAIFFLLSSLHSWGQLHEKFDDNHNLWPLETDDATRKIESSKYILETSNGGKFIDMPKFFAPDRDFEMEASFVQRSGLDNNGFGLFWAKVSPSNKPYNEFVITTNGYYMIGVSGMTQWVKTDLVKPMGQQNVLRVEKKGSNFSCFLNGDRILKIELPSHGFKAGFINYTQMVLEVDYFTFDQEGTDIKLVENLPRGLVKENLGSGVNTIADDVAPIISSDGRVLYFGRESYEYNIGGIADGEDIWISTFDGGQWQQAVNPGMPLNNSEINNLASVSADNNSLIVARRNSFDFRRRTVSSWSEAEDSGINYINESNQQESQFASDGKTMLLTIKNPNNIYYNKDIDERDIYVCLQGMDGRWGDPKNLGPIINTRGDEASPFLASDGRTLYFGSNGLPGYGGSDIFMTKRIGDGWTNWTEPRNLGPEVNSPGFDAYYTLPASGEYAYMVSDLNSLGKTDIFRIKLPQEIKPDPVVLLSGQTFNAKNSKPISAEIILDDLSTGKEVAEANSNPASGSYKIVLQPGVNYGIHAAAKGYLSVNENIELSTIHEYAEMKKDLFLVPIEVGLTLALNNVFFEQGKPVLRKESYPELDRLVQIMIDNPRMQIELAGHTDNVGSGTALMKLSQDRVAEVKKYLESHSISTHRIAGRGFGATQPKEKNDTEEHRKMNRRVEFKVLRN